MSHLTDRQAFDLIQRRVEILANAGKGLEAIGNLMGADASEHHLTADDQMGLAHAVAAMGAMIFATANEAWGYAALDREEWT